MPVKTSIGARSTQLKIQTAPQAAAQAIREAIIAGELRGGHRIIEQRWAERLGIGQPTLREALQELEHQGLLRKLHQRGTYVTQLSPDDYRLIQEVRIPMEAIAVGKAAENFSAEADKEFTEIVEKMAGSGISEIDVKLFHESDVAFHRKIWDLAGNPFLRNALETITFRLFIFSVVDRWSGNPRAVSERLAAVQEHLAILEGLRSRDKKMARQVFIRQTIEYWNAQYNMGLEEADLDLSKVRPG
ncbi:MAG: GntR family transcriptional regulator [Candidatus Sulfotelmatobacter sp.]|jgi:DNA-binding GntR family transcriptional regulator